MEEIVLDASALLAALQNEPGGDKVAALLLDDIRSAVMSTLNWSEVFDRLLRSGISTERVELLLARLAIKTVEFSREHARVAAEYRIKAPSLSLADRACLALTSERGATAWTTDKLWSKSKVGVPVEVLR